MILFAVHGTKAGVSYFRRAAWVCQCPVGDTRYAPTGFLFDVCWIAGHDNRRGDSPFDEFGACE